MTMADLESQRHAQERGEILRTLKEDYAEEMTSAGSLLRVLDAQGVSLSLDGLEFHLAHLAHSGYVRIWRGRDLPNYRTDRRSQRSQKPAAIMFARLQPHGLKLLDGLIPEDPTIAF